MKNLFLMIVPLTLAVACTGNEVKWDATGSFEATEVTVSAEGSGNILSLSITEGQMLESGEFVGQIDTVQLYLNKLQLTASRSGAMSQRADIAKQIAATEQQIRWQESEQSRFEKLLSQNAATAKQLDDITNQISVLKRQLAAQRSTLENSNRSISDQAQALEVQIAQVEDQLRKCRITSPIRGTVLVRYAEQGEFTAVGKPLFTVANLDQIYLRAYITADQLTQMKLGQKVRVYADFGADSQREYQGIVEWISPRSEFTPKTIQTRDERANLVYAIKIATQNDGYLKIGMYGQVVLE